jgi:hypothetical protein
VNENNFSNPVGSPMLKKPVEWSGLGVGSVFRPGQCRQRPDPRRRSSVRCVRVRLAVAACYDQGVGGVVRHGRWNRGPAWAVPAASGLAVAVRIWAGTVVSFFSSCLRGKWVKTIVMIRCFSDT